MVKCGTHSCQPRVHAAVVVDWCGCLFTLDCRRHSKQLVVHSWGFIHRLGLVASFESPLLPHVIPEGVGLCQDVGDLGFRRFSASV
jgi:hypothetical protein